MHSQQIQFSTSADGVRIAYATSGKGSPIVMVANWLTHLTHQWQDLAWRPWLQALSERHTLLRFDSRGCGLSDRDVPEISMDRWVQDLECVIDASGFDHFPLLGICQGGAVAIEYAARHPERVSSLILYSAFARGRLKRAQNPDQAAQQAEIARVTVDLARLGWGQENHAYMRTFALMWQPGGTLENLRSWCELQRVTTTPDAAARSLRAGFETDVVESARHIRCPTLVVHAERDQVVPIEEARILAAAIPGARFLQVNSENHLPLPDEPAWKVFLDELDRFSQKSGRAQGGFAGISPREREVLEAIAQGLDNAQIAARMGLSEKTVRNHVSHIFGKLLCENRSQAIVRAREVGFGNALR